MLIRSSFPQFRPGARRSIPSRFALPCADLANALCVSLVGGPGFYRRATLILISPPPSWLQRSFPLIGRRKGGFCCHDFAPAYFKAIVDINRVFEDKRCSRKCG